MTLFDKMVVEKSKKYTKNGASCFSGTQSHLLDLYGQLGSLRSRLDEVDSMFEKAYKEDSLLATKLAFYCRDIRGGLGERSVGRTFFKYLSNNHPEVMLANLKYIGEYGRWDDLLVLLDTPLKKEVINLIHQQLSQDVENMFKGNGISLLAKWLPSINTSSYKTKSYARMLCEAMNMSSKEYRKLLSSLRAYINVTEKRMSEKNYSVINYEAVSSYAMKKYYHAFFKQDNERFKTYLDGVKQGALKMNSKVLYPYDIVEKYFVGTNYYRGIDNEDEVLEQMWKALPDYTDGENYLVMADVSGSMYGRAMNTSVGLAIYFAQRSKGAFKNKFMTFSSEPSLISLEGINSLKEAINITCSADWGMNTNLESAFNLVLATAVNNGCKTKELPKAIIIISDMEIDRCTDINSWGFYDGMKAKFKKYGYDIPGIVFWNVGGHGDTFHAKKDTKGVQLASGHSTSVFNNIMADKEVTAYESMVEILESERYNVISLS